MQEASKPTHTYNKHTLANECEKRIVLNIQSWLAVSGVEFLCVVL